MSRSCGLRICVETDTKEPFYVEFYPTSTELDLSCCYIEEMKNDGRTWRVVTEDVYETLQKLKEGGDD